eukprot:CAMPEP_0173348366 /NCGR_PEP_ID=MMETSP1144-20121109/13690_1 /TAXON_ID=483371 /ORGANISM="non described non described, Strain CCMP2298" /LENGTH=138 /DNA_ID=CAMNT_0014295997 /DNA_START=366 /DNA_END=779 /DNA_ORIENTATION=+
MKPFGREPQIPGVSLSFQIDPQTQRARRLIPPQEVLVVKILHLLALLHQLFVNDIFVDLVGPALAIGGGGVGGVGGESRDHGAEQGGLTHGSGLVVSVARGIVREVRFVLSLPPRRLQPAQPANYILLHRPHHPVGCL